MLTQPIFRECLCILSLLNVHVKCVLGLKAMS